MQDTLAGASDLWYPAIDEERDVAFLEASAEERTVAIRQGVVQDGARKPIVLNQEQGVPQRVRRRHLDAGMLKSVRDIHDDKGLILDHEDRSPSKCRALHE
jgi:hypothetical protein